MNKWLVGFVFLAFRRISFLFQVGYTLLTVVAQDVSFYLCILMCFHTYNTAPFSICELVL